MHMNDRAQGFLSQQFAQRSKAIGAQVSDTAKNIHTLAQQMRQDAITEKAAEIAESAASMLEKFGSYIQEHDLDAMLADAERFSRQRPWTVAFGGFMIGMSASRLIKAGAARRSTLSHEPIAPQRAQKDYAYAN